MLDKYKAKAARQIAAKAKIPGFRPGKAPYDVIARLYGESEIEDNAIELMMQELRSVPDSRKVLDQLNPSLVNSQTGLADVPELRDPWGTVLDYVYDRDAGDNVPELISAGPDRQFGTGDDISSKGRR